LNKTGRSQSRIVFLRHGHALSSAEAGIPRDADRPLSELGREASAAAAEALFSSGFKPEIIVSSPVLRAKTTAEIVASRFGCPVSELKELDGDFPTGRVWKALAGILRQKRSVIAVGHQPVMGELSGGLLGAGRCALLPAEFVCLRFEGEIPPDISAGFAVKEVL